MISSFATHIDHTHHREFVPQGTSSLNNETCKDTGLSDLPLTGYVLKSVKLSLSFTLGKAKHTVRTACSSQERFLSKEWKAPSSSQGEEAKSHLDSPGSPKPFNVSNVC